VSDAERIAGLYERHAMAFVGLRGTSLVERSWLDRFAALMPSGGRVVDLGCGSGEPMASALIADGFRLTGVDSSETLIGLCHARHPAHDWQVGDMRSFSPPAQFDGILAWHSFFHLTPEDQRLMFPRFAMLAAEGAALMFTSGPSHGVAMGTFEGEPLYHASLDGEEYRALLAKNGFAVMHHVREDPECGGATVWLARAT
jgi:trans-aconitate methyltransferase